MAKKSKAEAHYQAKSTTARKCANCSMFRSSGKFRNPARCTLVEGDIQPGGVCRFWEPK